MQFILKRLLTIVVTLWIIITLTFIIMHLIPGDPFPSDAKSLPEEIVQNMRAKYNLDNSLPVQYILYLKNLTHFDLGPSIQSKSRDVNALIADEFGSSALLGIQSLILGIVVGIALGIIAALNHNRTLDYFSMFIAILEISVPSFILAPLLIKDFSVKWELLPVASWGTWKHSILPTIALSLSPIAINTRFVCTSMLEEVSLWKIN